MPLFQCFELQESQFWISYFKHVIILHSHEVEGEDLTAFYDVFQIVLYPEHALLREVLSPSGPRIGVNIHSRLI